MLKIEKVFKELTKEEIVDVCKNSKSKSEIFKTFQISDNKVNWDYFKELLERLNINFDSFHQKEKRYCLNCGKELTSNQKKFCCVSCSAQYNNVHRENVVYQKVSNTLKKFYESEDGLKKKEQIIINSGRNLKPISEKKKIHKKRIKVVKEKCYCLNCGKELIKSQTKFCSQECLSVYTEKEHYQYFLSHPEEFCRNNFTPRTYIRKFILEEQNQVCSICGSPQEHNGKPLVFVLDHIDGNSANNYRNNLRMICPNCDSQLPTFKSKNKNSARRDYLRENVEKQLIEKIRKGELRVE